MKRILKSDLASAAGVSNRTFQRWARLHRDHLLSLGYDLKAQYVTPTVARYICQEYCIELDEF